MKAKIEEKIEATDAIESTVLSATNGKKYKITDLEKGKVKRVDVLKDFVANPEIYSMAEEQELQNTKTLFKFLKSTLGENVVLKSGFVKYNGFKMWYNSHGFKIVDTLNFNEEMNMNEYNNDLAYPKDVLEFIKKVGERPVTPPKREKETIRIIEKLSEKFLVVDKDGVTKKVREIPREAVIKDREEQVIQTTETRRKERIEKVIVALLDAAKANSKVSILKELAMRISQKKDVLKLLVTEITKFKKGTLTKRVFEKNIRSIAKPLIERQIEEKPVRVPRFKGLDFMYEPVNLIVKGDKVTFEQRDPAGKLYGPETIGIHEYMVNIVLNECPKAMELLTKVAEGETFNLLELDMEKFIRDISVEYNARVFRNTKNAIHLIEVCQEILWHYEVATALDYLFSNELKKGDLVKVFFQDTPTWYSGKITSTEKGVRVLYEDGDVLTVLKHQRVIKLA